ncbi:MAG: glutamate--tRNA ligase, partial [Chlorobi bacterium]|nr:glutamate--tRNA ligase [Chlorobiota bacterium]
LKPILVDKEYDICAEYITQVVDLFRERVHFVHEFAEIADYMFVKPTEFEEKYANKHWKEDTVELMMPLIEIYKNEDDFEHEHMYEVTKEYVESKEIKFKQIIHPIRLMITGKSAGAGMFETMEVLGKEECIERFESYINNI